MVERARLAARSLGRRGGEHMVQETQKQKKQRWTKHKISQTETERRKMEDEEGETETRVQREEEEEEERNERAAPEVESRACSNTSTFWMTMRWS